MPANLKVYAPQQIQSSIIPSIFTFVEMANTKTPSCFSSTISAVPEGACTNGGQAPSVEFNGSMAPSFANFSSGLLLAPAGVTTALEFPLVEGSDC
jgi:hypothetical protein